MSVLTCLDINMTVEIRMETFLLYFFFWPLCYLFFFDIRFLISPLVSSNSSFKLIRCPAYSLQRQQKILSRKIIAVHHEEIDELRLWLFNVTFNNNLIISLRSALLVVETRLPIERYILHRNVLLGYCYK